MHCWPGLHEDVHLSEMRVAFQGYSHCRSPSAAACYAQSTRVWMCVLCTVHVPAKFERFVRALQGQCVEACLANLAVQHLPARRSPVSALLYSPAHYWPALLHLWAGGWSVLGPARLLRAGHGWGSSFSWVSQVVLVESGHALGCGALMCTARLLRSGLRNALVIHPRWAAMSVQRAGMQPCPLCTAWSQQLSCSQVGCAGGL
jgi:hypothetical protein